MEMSYAAPAVPFVADPVEPTKRRKPIPKLITAQPPAPPPTPESVPVPPVANQVPDTPAPTTFVPTFVPASSLLTTTSDVVPFRFGYDRYLYLVKLASGQVKICLGGVLSNPGISVSNKNIELNIRAFFKLYGLFLSGKATAEVRPNEDVHGRLSPMYYLDDDVYFTWSRWNKQDVATVRRFKQRKNLDFYPTKEGFSFTEKYYYALLEIFKTKEPLRQLARLMLGVGSAAPEFPWNPKDTMFTTQPIHDAIARALYHLIYVRRGSTCQPCTDYTRGNGLQYMQMRRVPGHTCVSKSGGITTGDGPVTEEEWNLTVDTFKADQTLEAYLLMLGQFRIGDIVNLKTDEYLNAHRDELQHRINNYLKDSVRFEINIFEYRNEDSSPVV